jgi:selenide,water dikinase
MASGRFRQTLTSSSCGSSQLRDRRAQRKAADMDYPLVKDVVLVGGGHAHALVARMWAMDPTPGVRLTIINPDPTAPYTGMLPGLIAGHYTQDEIMIDLVRLARFAGARLILDRVTGIDRDHQRLILQKRAPVPYDLLSLDIGITSDLPQVTGFAEHGHAAKPLGNYAQKWAAFLARDLDQPNLVLIGAGVGGVELALASAHQLRAKFAKITLIQRSETALAGVGAVARAMLLDALHIAGVTLITGAEPVQIMADRVILQDGREVASDFTLAVAGARAQGWLEHTGLRLHEGFVTVSPKLQSSDPLIFAAGDCTDLSFAPRAKAGVYAVRAAPVLLHNLRAVLQRRPLRAFAPQRDYLKLVSLGGQNALADKWGLPLRGAWLWRQKDGIDRAFMAKFADYPAMVALALPSNPIAGLAETMGGQPLCGGCGAKLGAQDLAQGLRALPAPKRADVLSGRGDDAAILRMGAGVQVITTDHLRAFSCDPAMMGRIAAIHALGDIWAMGAVPQAALAQITLPAASGTMGARILADVMNAAAEVFTAHGADMVGGHSTTGAELTVGFTVTGLASRAITKGGAVAGNALILTKPLGSGVIMAAEMAMVRVQGVVLGEVVAGAIAQMCRAQGDTAAILSEAKAMTDVTGFGLAGHLLEMLAASNLSAELTEIPTMVGVIELVATGIGSSLLPANLAATQGRIIGASPAQLAILNDPQTAGGLLAAVPADQATALVERLRAGGDEATIIGHLRAGAPIIRVV